MTRKPVTRSLPTLRSLHPRFHGLDPAGNSRDALTVLLRETIARVRRDTSHPFYSIRQVAEFFGVSLKTVAGAYEKLEADGLLTRLRGSHTLVQGRVLQPRHPVRGVVGIPIYLPPLVIGTDWRLFLTRLEEELRRYHFVTDFIFYRSGENEDLTERLLEHKLDMVMWYVPTQAHVQTMLRLRDGGIRLVVISDGKGQFPCEQYFLNLAQALRDGINDWRTHGVNSITILRSLKHPSAHAFGLMQQVLRQRGVSYEVCTVADADVPATIARLTRHRNTGVILLSHIWYESLCGKFPSEMEALFTQTRVFLTQGPVYSPYFEGKPVYADSIDLPNDQIARRLARDIHTQRAFRPERLATFHSRYQPRVNLGAVTREL